MNTKEIVVRVAVALLAAGLVTLIGPWPLGPIVGLLILVVLQASPAVAARLPHSKLIGGFIANQHQGFQRYHKNQTRAIPYIQRAAKRTIRLDIMLIRGHDWLVGENPIINRLLEDTDSAARQAARILLLQPQSAYMAEYVAARGLTEAQKDEYYAKCEAVRGRLEELREQRRVVFAHYNFRPIWKLVITDSVLFVADYELTKRGRELEIREYTDAGKRAYRSYLKYFEDMWTK